MKKPFYFLNILNVQKVKNSKEKNIVGPMRAAGEGGEGLSEGLRRGPQERASARRGPQERAPGGRLGGGISPVSRDSDLISKKYNINYIIFVRFRAVRRPPLRSGAAAAALCADPLCGTEQHKEAEQHRIRGPKPRGPDLSTKEPGARIYNVHNPIVHVKNLDLHQEKYKLMKNI